MAPYGAAQGRRFLPSRQQAFNRSLSTVRITVENAFSMVQRLWIYTAFGKSLAAGKQPVGAIFAVAVLLTNCHSYLRGNQISEQFGVPLLWWGEMAPLPKKSPDLGNSSPVPRALMYVASLRTSVYHQIV
jgi:hypothetical protein